MIGRRGVLAASTLLAAPALAQERYPSRPVTVVNPWPPGGSSDTMARVVMQRMSAILGQNFVVENRPGASGTVGTGTVARARPDGYTLLFGTNSTYAIAPHLMEGLPYDSATAFAGISLVGRMAQSFCVHPSVPANTLAEFLALARGQPGQLTFSSAGNGATSHLATELLMARSGINLLHVPYRGGAPSAQAVVTGEVRCSFIDLITALPFSRGGTVRILAVSTAARSSLAPDVPTIAEAGVPGFESSTDAAFMAPAGTPEPIIRRLNEALREAIAHPETRQALIAQAVEPIGSTPQEFADYLTRENAKWSEIIRSRGIRLG